MVETGLSTVRHLWFGLRALAFLRVDPARQRAIGPEPVIVVALLILADIALSIFKVEDVQLTALGVSATLAYVALLTAGLLLIGARKRGIDLASMIATLTAMALFGTLLLAAAGAVGTPVFEATGVSANKRAWITAIAGSGWLAAYFAALWLYGARATQIDPRRFGLGVAIATLAAAFILPNTPIVEGANESDGEGLLQTAFDTVRFRRPRGPEEPRSKPIDVEAAFARQTALIDAQLDTLAPAQPGKGQVFFVGMATYSEQDVFKREINSVREIVDDRFETRGRSVLMINHRDTVETFPLANATNLERVLWRIAQRMDQENDALVLYITTHGSEGHMAVTFPGFSLNGLTPEKLSGILERTGIRNKVVILSACHAGSFLPALSGPDTLVMAAARADRSSFGCSNERDWTYFGDALFNHALRETHSFSGAFERAKTLVGQWETGQKLSPPSEPQIAIGERIAGKLDALARRLDGRTDAVSE